MNPPNAIPIKKIVVAVDLSPRSEATARHAAKLAGRFGAHLTLPYVGPPPQIDELMTDEGYAAFERQRELAEQRLKSLAIAVRNDHVTYDAMLLNGEPMEEIVFLAETLGADLIVASVDYPGAFEHPAGADQTLATARQAPCPILVYQDKPGPGSCGNHASLTHAA